MLKVLHLILKKVYAISLLEHLLHKEQGIEMGDNDAINIADWQKEAVSKTLRELRLHPCLSYG